jgi:integrase
MSITWSKARERWHWQFKARIDGQVHRHSKILPSGWSEALARQYDERETAKTYARISLGGRTSSIPLIEDAVSSYLRDCIPVQKDGRHTALTLKSLYPYFKGRGLNELGAVCRDFRAANTHLAPATQRQRLANLRAACRHSLREHGLGSIDYIAQMSLPTVKNDRHMYLTRAQIVRWARACKFKPGRALILMTFATGSRPGECHASEVQGNALLLPEDKNGNRVLKPVDSKVRTYLRHWPQVWGYSWVSKHMRESRRAVGLADYKQHDLRHSTASALLSEGYSLGDVGAVLDHASAQSTKRYAHLYDERKKELLRTLWKK